VLHPAGPVQGKWVSWSAINFWTHFFFFGMAWQQLWLQLWHSDNPA